MNLKFTPIDYDYFDFEGRNVIKLIGRTESEKRICVLDECPVYLWAILEDGLNKKRMSDLIEKIQKIKFSSRAREIEIKKVEIHQKKFLGRDVTAMKIFIDNYKDLPELANHLKLEGIEFRRGQDVPLNTHYIIERKIIPNHWYEIEAENVEPGDFGKISDVLDVDLCVKLQKFKEIKGLEFNPKILAFDIETDEIEIGKGEIIMLSLYSHDFKKVLTLKKTKSSADYLEVVKNERELLQKFAEYVKKISPDFLVGYFSDGFDLPYLKARANENDIKLSIGLDQTPPTFSRGVMLTGKVDGIVHIDLLRFIRTAYSQYMQSESLALNEVAKEFLGETKVDFKFKHSSKIKEDEWEKYFEYNLQDSALTYKLFRKMWPDILQFSKVIEEPIFEVTRNGMSKNVESYILHHLEDFNEIPERKPKHEEVAKRINREKYEGAFVFEPTPGLYENLGMFDFTSYWPSIIITFNLSKSTLLKKKEKDSIETEVLGRKVYFSKKTGFFPELLKGVIEKRKQYKKELKENPDVMKKARSNSYKLLANSAYGYMGFFGARYYCPEASGAATAISRDFIKKIIGKINEKGYKTIYSDTDSIAFLLNNQTRDVTLQFLKKLNYELPGVMELELEGFFKRGLWVSTRSGKTGAKKKYALIDEENKLKIRGFETVRRDWCQLARRVQSEVIKKILEEGNEKGALELVKNTIKKVKERKFDLDNMVIKTQLKKSLSEYKSISPHVIAAKKMKELKIPVQEGGLIEYYIAETKDKKKLVRDKVKLREEKGEYDINYYLDHQIIPAVENIFQVFKVNIQEISDGKKQMTLGDFK